MAVHVGITPVNWQSPLARDLALLCDLSRSPGSVMPRNIAGGVTIAPVKYGSGTISMGSSAFGTGVQFPPIATTGGFDLCAASQFYGKTRFSVMWQGRFNLTNDIGSNSTLFGNGTAGAGDYNWFIGADNDANSGGTQKFWFYPKNGAAVTSASTYAYHSDYVIVGTYDNTTATIYINGRLDAEAAITGSTATAGGNRIMVNNGFYDGPQCVVRSVALWDRCLSPIEVAQLSVNPLRQLLRPAPQLADMYVPAAGGGGGARFNPAWARNSNVMIGVA